MDDIVGGVPLAPPGLPPVLLPIGVHYGKPHGYYSSGQGGYVTVAAATMAAVPGMATASPATRSPATAGYDFGRPGYNPGGLGGPASGIGVRPGLGAGGFGPGR